MNIFRRFRSWLVRRRAERALPDAVRAVEASAFIPCVKKGHKGGGDVELVPFYSGYQGLVEALRDCAAIHDREDRDAATRRTFGKTAAAYRPIIEQAAKFRRIIRRNTYGIS